METPKFPAIPKALLKKGKEDLQKHQGYYSYHQKIIHEVEKDGKVWIYSWESDNGEYTPDMITVMTPKCWKTWDGKKWGKKVINPSTWYGYTMIYDHQLDKKKFGYTIEELQQQKQKEKTARINKTKQDIIDSVVSKMKKIPKKVEKWAHENSKHYILFEAGKKTGFCTNCAAHSKFERLRNRHYLKCPKCGHIIEARTYKTVPTYTSRFFMWFQKCEGGFLLRTFRLNRINPRSVDETVTIPEEHFYEYLCISMIDGEERWLEKRYFYDEEWKTPEECDRWYLNRSYGATKNYLAPYCDYDRNERRLRDNRKELDYYLPATYGSEKEWIDISDFTLRYIKDYVAIDDGLDMFRLERRLKRHPQIEGLYKNGFEALADDMLYETYWYGYDRLDSKEMELHKFLKIKKETLRLLMESGENTIIQIEGIEALQRLEETDVKQEDLITTLHAFANHRDIREMTQLAERLEIRFVKLYKYLAGKDDGYHVKQSILNTYSDYIDMCYQERIDMTNTFNLFPKDIVTAHDSLLLIEEERKAKEAKKAAEAKDEALAASVKKLVKRFTLEDDAFIIRPATSATEIVMEGQAQHNCVGRAGYIDKMIKHKCMILFLRKKEAPDESFYTVETDMRGNLKQAYAKNNRKTEDYEKVIKPLLDKLKKKVQKDVKKRATAG